MATWAEIQNHIRKNYILAEDAQKYMALDFECPGGRKQRMVLSYFESMSKRWVLYRSRVCERSRLDPEEALRRNAGFAVGFLALSENFYELVYTAQLDTIDTNELELPLYVLSETADQLERELTGADNW